MGTNQLYHYIVIADATAYCAQGLEFILTDEKTAYPQRDDEIEISGIFGVFSAISALQILDKVVNPLGLQVWPLARPSRLSAAKPADFSLDLTKNSLETAISPFRNTP